MRHGLEVTEYSPKKVKQGVTGNGNASKEQVMKMLQTILQFKDSPKHYDATDAVGVAVCHFYQHYKRIPAATATPTAVNSKPAKKSAKKKNDWADFIQKNPQRISKK